MKLKTELLFIIICTISYIGYAQDVYSEYTTEWQWNMKEKTNWVNLFRLNLFFPLWKNGSLEAATIHVARTNECIIDDWQVFSNIEEENKFAAIAVLGYMHTWKNAHLFIGVRNVNEDFFISDATSLFINSSCGIFPTISASYPIANYPLSGLTLYFDVSYGGWIFKNSLYNGVGYSGWSRHDNPFLVRPKQDGVFDMAQIEYEYNNGLYCAGFAIHNRLCPVSKNSEKSSMEETLKKTSCAWWIYGEQPIWTVGKRKISLMVQYSENTCRQNGCYRYGELGCVYSGGSNQIGLSGQYAQFSQGTENSIELTWSKKINELLFIQPTFQYIRNGCANFAVLSARIYYKFKF